MLRFVEVLRHKKPFVSTDSSAQTGIVLETVNDNEMMEGACGLYDLLSQFCALMRGESSLRVIYETHRVN